jgi:hypothetical protein
MRKKMAILVSAITLCVILPISSFSQPVVGEVNFYASPPVSGFISFAGGDAPLVINMSGEGYFDWVFMAFSGATYEFYPTWYSNYFGYRPMTTYDAHFETGPRIGTGYDFRGGSLDIPGVLTGPFGNVHVDDNGLSADLYGAHSWYGGGELGHLYIRFSLPSEAPDPFIITSIQYFGFFLEPVPIPPTVLLLGSGLLGLAGWRRFRKS